MRGRGYFAFALLQSKARLIDYCVQVLRSEEGNAGKATSQFALLPSKIRLIDYCVQVLCSERYGGITTRAQPTSGHSYSPKQHKAQWPRTLC